MRPWNHWLNIKISRIEGSTNGTSTRESSLANTEFFFVHSYILYFISFIGQYKHQLYLGCSLRLSSGLLCNEQEWPHSLLEYEKLHDYPILTPLVSFDSLCASFEAGLIHSFIGKFNLNRHRSCKHHEIQCHETPHQKEMESLAKVTQNMLAYTGIEPHKIPILAV